MLNVLTTKTGRQNKALHGPEKLLIDKQGKSLLEAFKYVKVKFKASQHIFNCIKINKILMIYCVTFFMLHLHT